MLFKPKKESVSFSGIIRGLQQAVSSAQEMLQTQQVENFQRFFDANNKPLSQTVQVGDKTINVPLMSVVPHNSLVMENVIIRFKAKVGAATVIAGSNNLLLGAGELTSANFDMQMDGISTKDSDTMEITIRFKAKETPEAVARVLDEYNKLI